MSGWNMFIQPILKNISKDIPAEITLVVLYAQ